MPRDESDILLAELFAHNSRIDSLYRHQWRFGDLLMWDNCLTQHRAIRDYELPLRRRMHRTTVSGYESPG
jgi:taurine dioxygenase